MTTAEKSKPAAFDALEKGGMNMANYSKTLNVDGNTMHIQNPGKNVVTVQQLIKVKQEKVTKAKEKQNK